jgi:hypothetical protein
MPDWEEVLEIYLGLDAIYGVEASVGLPFKTLIFPDPRETLAAVSPDLFTRNTFLIQRAPAGDSDPHIDRVSYRGTINMARGKDKQHA